MSGDATSDSGYIRLIHRLLVTFALASLALPVTEAVAQPNAAQQSLERRLGPQAVVDVDESTGTPRVLARLDGTLTGATSGAPEDVAMSYVRQNLDVLGLTESDLDTLEAPKTSTANGVTAVRWRQSVDGIPAADSELRVNVTRDGRILNVLGAPVSGLDPDTTPALTPGEAVREVQESVGVFRALPRDSGPAGARQATEYADGSEAKLTLFNGGLAWRVLYYASSREVYDAFVDAETGRVMQAHNMVKDAAPASVWERYPGAPLGGTPQSVDLETLGYLTVGETVLSGPFVRAWSDLTDNGTPDGVSEEIQRTGGSFAFAFTPRTTGAGCSTQLSLLLELHGREQLAAEPQPERRPGLLPREPLPRTTSPRRPSTSRDSPASTASSCRPMTGRTPGPTTITATTRTCSRCPRARRRSCRCTSGAARRPVTTPACAT